MNSLLFRFAGPATNGVLKKVETQAVTYAENAHLDDQLRNNPFEADLLVCQISNDAVWGIEFLSHQKFSVALEKGLLVMASKTFPCTDRMGQLLTYNVQMMRTLTIPPDCPC